MTDLLIVGAGGHGRVVADAACSFYERIAFLDDVAQESSDDWPVLGRPADVERFADQFSEFAVAFGDNEKRLLFSERVLGLGLKLALIIHPTAAMSARSSLGSGTVVMAQAAINGGTTLGRSCIVNTGATVDHDCRLGNAVHVSPGAHLAGRVTVGDRAWIGVGAAVKDGVSIGADSIVGAGAAVVDDVAARTVVRGVPAR